MADFQQALKVLLAAEGPGGVDDPNDPGGMTVWGITRQYESSWPGWQRFDQLHKGFDKPCKAKTACLWYDDDELMEAVTNYYMQAFVDLHLPQMHDQAMAASFFGAFVNEGPKVVKWLQAVVGIAQDGAMGPATISATNAGSFWDKFALKRIAYYAETAKPEYLRGLINRVLTGA